MISTDLIKNHPKTRDSWCSIWLEVLGQKWLPKITRADLEQWFEAFLSDSIPLGLVALDGHKPVGFCSLQMNDGIRPDLSPWLGDLVVSSDAQGQGIGRQLIAATVQIAHDFGYKSLYLFTFDLKLIPYYEQQGWVPIGIDQHEGKQVYLMKRDL